jgi:hypothetical protein
MKLMARLLFPILQKKTPSLISFRVEVFTATKHFSDMGHALSLSNLEFQCMEYYDVLGILAEGWQ